MPDAAPLGCKENVGMAATMPAAVPVPLPAPVAAPATAQLAVPCVPAICNDLVLVLLTTCDYAEEVCDL